MELCFYEHFYSLQHNINPLRTALNIEHFRDRSVHYDKMQSTFTKL